MFLDTLQTHIKFHKVLRSSQSLRYSRPIILKLMPFKSVLSGLDRLSVRSVMRGSTSTICGIIGTLAVVVICLAIYIPTTMSYIKGDYYESEFFHQKEVAGSFYSDRDFKMAIQFRSRLNNSVANHSAILSWAFSQFYQLTGDYSARYHQPSALCRPSYFEGTLNPVQLSDCFLFPDNSLFEVIKDQGFSTYYSSIFYWLYVQQSVNPFTSSTAGQALGNYAHLQKLYKEYYYIVYFTSVVIDRSSGVKSLQVNRYYSTEAAFSSAQYDSHNLLIYHQKQYHMDISIMPWQNNVTAGGLIWLGKTVNLAAPSGTFMNSFGISVEVSLDRYGIQGYRYYRKLDWLLGIIGGAMLLIYILLWVPCAFINRTYHRINNTQQLLLINHSAEEEPLTQSNVYPANVSHWYWLSNPFTDCLLSNPKAANHLVQSAERELDIVMLIKKLKVTQRSLKKKDIHIDFKPKVLQLRVIEEEIQMHKKRPQPEATDLQGEDEDDDDEEQLSEQLIHEEVLEENFVEMPVDQTFGLTDQQLSTLKNEERLKNVYQNNMTANVILQSRDQTIKLKEMATKSKFKGKYISKRKVSKVRKFWGCLCDLVEHFDFFGVRPNLSAQPYGSSFVGLCGVFMILGLTILTVALTLRNSNKPQIMIDHNYQEKANFQYTLVSGQSLKFAVCFQYSSYFRGSGRYANLRFFTQSKAKGRKYYQAIDLTSSDYALFDLDPNHNVPLSFCFMMPSGQEVIMANTPDNYGYFGFRADPYCSSTSAFCSTYSYQNNDKFDQLMNATSSRVYLPENRFDSKNMKFINNLVNTPLNVDYRYFQPTTGLEETLFVDQVRIQDDTANWFMRKQPINTFQGIASNEHTLFPLSKNINSTAPFYEVKIKPSSMQVNYVVTTPKADTILGIVGGVFILWYAILHWLGKVYNGFHVRAKMAQEIYYQDSCNQSPLNKLLTISPLPNCLIPSCYNIKADVVRMRQIEKKIQNDLNYLYLVKYVDTVFWLSSSLFDRLQAKNLSLVSIKEKIDENQRVHPPVEELTEVQEVDFLGADDGNTLDETKLLENSTNRVADDSIAPEMSKENMLNDTTTFDKFRPTKRQVREENGPDQPFTNNYMHGLPKQPRFNWLDTFEYPASLTLQGKRESTSTCGGCCCLLLFMFICIIGAFEVSVYLDKDDERIGMTTALMQPLQNNQNSTYNSQIHLESGKNFKFAVTFSSAYHDYPHDVTNWTNSAIGISILQEIFTPNSSGVATQTVEIPMVPCPADYLTSWMDPNSDASYYINTQMGYCVPDGITLMIDGLPEDAIVKRFKLTIYNKLGTTAGNTQVQQFMQIHLPKFHLSNAIMDPSKRQFDYHMNSFTLDGFNVTYPTSQNISLQKVVVLYDNQLINQSDSFQSIGYAFTQFQQRETSFVDYFSNTPMSYNLSFANSYLIKYYTFENQKFPATFGIIGGLIAIFIFGFGCLARGFNQYNMRYQIGKELYLFDLLKKKQARNIARGRKNKTKEEINKLSDSNNMSQAEVLLAYLLSFPALVLGYNINDTLRRVTLIQQKVEKDIDLFEVYKKLHNFRDILNKHYNYTDTPICDIHPKHIYNPTPETRSLVNQARLIAFAKKHNWTCFEQFAVFEAATSSVNLRQVFDNAFLEKQLNMFNSDRTSVHISQFGGTQGSIGTNSVAEPSQMHREEEEEGPNYDL